MPRKAAKSDAVKQSLTDRIDKLFEQGDPLLAAAMLLGGTAAATGIEPPLMRLIRATTSASNSDFEQLSTVAAAFAGGLVPGLVYLGTQLGNGGSTNTEEAKGAKYYTACFAEGAVEVFLMAKLFGNPEFMKAVMGAASQGAGLLKAAAVTGL